MIYNIHDDIIQLYIFIKIITVLYIMNPLYFTPRLAVATLTTQLDFQNVRKQVEMRHKGYYHFFNLTNVKLPGEKEANFKWRGMPFSLSEAIKILTQIDIYLKANIANTAIICTSNPHNTQYAKLTIKCYLQLCLLSSSTNSNKKSLKILKIQQSIENSHPYFFTSFQTIYKNIKTQLPPLKYLQSLEISPNLFIPMVEIHNESRYNDFQTVYYHKIEEELAVYYVNLNKPLETGIGKRYYDSKPETKYFSKPILVFGDVKIIIYSYTYLKKIQEFTLGFNTLNINELTSNNTLILTLQDLYDPSKEIQQSKDIKIKITFSEYCDNVGCRAQANCLDCKDGIKNIANRYNQVQGQLQKLNRKRSIEQCEKMLSL